MARVTINNGDTGLVARTALNANFTELYGAQLPKPPTVVCIGDSLGTYLGGVTSNSPWFWSQIKGPRFYNHEINDVVAGSVAGTSSSNIITTTIKNAVAALPKAPDIGIFVTGMNDASCAAGFISSNVRQAIQYYGFKRNVIVPTTPNTQTATPEFMNQVGNFQSLMLQDQRVLVYNGLGLTILDDTGASYSPIGGSGGLAGAMTLDGRHWSPGAALAAEPSFSSLLDALGVPKTTIRPVSTGNLYNASTHPTGNLITNGNMQGSTAGTLFNNATGSAVSGVTATSWSNNSGDSRETTTVYSKDTITFNGTAYTAMKAVFSAAAPLTGTMQVSFKASSVAVATGAPLHVQALVETTGIVDCQSIQMQLVYTRNTVGKTVNFGSRASISAAANALNLSGTQQFQFVLPGYIQPDAGSSILFLIFVTALTGQQPSGTIKVAQASISPLPTTLP